jgi:hypothetical protein
VRNALILSSRLICRLTLPGGLLCRRLSWSNSPSALCTRGASSTCLSHALSVLSRQPPRTGLWLRWCTFSPRVPCRWASAPRSSGPGPSDPVRHFLCRTLKFGSCMVDAVVPARARAHHKLRQSFVERFHLSRLLQTPKNTLTYTVHLTPLAQAHARLLWLRRWPGAPGWC